MADHATLALATAAGSTVLMLGLWAWQVRHRDAGIVDAGWAFGLAVAAVVAGFVGEGSAAARWFVAVGGGLWGLRLATHLLTDRVIGRAEDGRYARMRAALGRHADLGFLAFFLFQAGLVVLFAQPLLVLAGDPRPWGGHLLAAGVVMAVGLTFETVADRQLAAFRADPTNAGITCARGLWRFCRHPNYFGEWLLWWGWLIAGLGAPSGGWLIAYPLLMYLFLRHLTGIPFTEARARAHRADYAAYAARTPMLFPWFPRSRP